MQNVGTINRLAEKEQIFKRMEIKVNKDKKHQTLNLFGFQLAEIILQACQEVETKRCGSLRHTKTSLRITNW